jgi:hypothetical protein
VSLAGARMNVAADPYGADPYGADSYGDPDGGVGAR